MRLTIHGELPGLNEYTKACRTSPIVGWRMKRECEEAIAAQVASAPHITEPVTAHFVWYTADSRRDPDNVAFAKKFVLDALVAAGVLRGDGRAHVLGFTDAFYVDRTDPRVEVTLL
jgi:Holliday junction resolvase RusA-like endonuclease